jgi:hypothetical protein
MKGVEYAQGQLKWGSDSLSRDDMVVQGEVAFDQAF